MAAAALRKRSGFTAAPPEDVFTVWIFVFSGRTNLNSCLPTAALFDSASESGVNNAKGWMQPGQPASTLVTADTGVKRGHGLRRCLETETTTKVAAVRQLTDFLRRPHLQPACVEQQTGSRAAVASSGKVATELQKGTEHTHTNATPSG